MIAYVSFIQLMAYTMQSLGSLLLRKLEKIVPELSNQQVMKTLKLAIYVLPLSTALMSAVVEYCSYTTQARRKSKIQKALSLKDEAQHYSNFLAQQWNQKSASSLTKEMATSEQLMFPGRLWYFFYTAKRWLQ
ncbi:unnamed protein product [Heligmosomoides polygyrus]|uniref:Inner membrane protein n=1 Tax=Heligmosomoides polygyrus TaxID=6339 RepID=A0A183G615_HELPZ|nr:unnamed protein product [Heligmosomoides polygyrus]